MKKLSSFAAIFATLSIVVSGCITDGTTTTTAAAGKQVRFTTDISTTRAYDNMWETGDRIGVYMLPAGSTNWSNPATDPLEQNMQYGHNLTSENRYALFSGIGDDVIIWPESGNVDFVAYYPYLPTNDLDGFIYPVNITDQNPLKAIDLLYSDDVTDRNSAMDDPALTFEHKLAKLEFRVTDIGEASLRGMTATFDDLPTRAGFNLSSGVIATASITGVTPFAALVHSNPVGSGDEHKALVEAIVLPGMNLDYTLTFELSNGETAVFHEEDGDYEEGMKYTYEISLKPRTMGVSFGEAGGSLSFIDNWTTAPRDPKEIDKSGAGSGYGSPWNSGPLANGSSGTVVTGGIAIPGDGYRVEEGNTMWIVKSDYTDKIASVTVIARTTYGGSGEISSVKVGGREFSNSGGGVRATISQNTDDEFIFIAPAGEFPSGNIEITVGSNSTAAIVHSFKVNTDIP